MEKDKPPERLSIRTKKPKKDSGANLLRWSKEELELITRAAEKADQPLPVYLRRTILRDAATRTGLAKTRLRGNQGDYVDGATRRPADAKTCSVHPGEPLYVTPNGPACSVCLAGAKAVGT